MEPSTKYTVIADRITCSNPQQMTSANVSIRADCILSRQGGTLLVVAFVVPTQAERPKLVCQRRKGEVLMATESVVFVSF